ncbi:MAG: RDD family protein [Gammaproteobacteria bacterium]|nr:RDD family protein [Gammaproteobacteria bacterium]MCW8987806.1 RDD family protein [Gammaproteobacteria bacterium]MCW9032200.1 RDD family protein [Gammaproteobacteria bacterium]
MSHPSTFKRLLASLYDSFLILATAFVATALTLPFTKGEMSAGNNIYMSLYLFMVIYIFYGWFWTHGGQTLGMRAWKQKLVQRDGSAVNWQQSFIRVITGLPAWFLFLVGIILSIKSDIAAAITIIPAWLFALTGFIWILLNTRNNGWQDKLSGTQVITVD